MYLNDDMVVFTSLCVGDWYRETIATQIQSILKFTHHEAYIVTDQPEYFGNYYGPRIHFLKLDDLTDFPLRGKQGMFNYNLKMIPIKWVIEHIKPTITTYLDADTFLFGWDRLFYRFFPEKEEGIWGRFRNRLNDCSAHKIILDKLEMMKVDATNIDTRLPIENVMFWKNGPTIPMVLDTWDKYAKHTYECGARTDFEGIELALAIHENKLHHVHMDNSSPYVDNFRTLHHNKLHIPFVI